MSSPAPRTWSPGVTAVAVRIAPSRTSTFSWGITDVAPAGIAAPVEILIASPLREVKREGGAGAGLADDRQRPAGVAGGCTA